MHAPRNEQTDATETRLELRKRGVAGVAQVEVAFREQTAGHNALLLFVHLALGMMEDGLNNAFRELRARQAEVKLLGTAAIHSPLTCDCVHIGPRALTMPLVHLVRVNGVILVLTT